MVVPSGATVPSKGDVMQQYASFTVTQEQIRREQEQRIAVLRSGYSFIILALTDRTKSRVTGVDALKMILTEDINNPRFEIVQRQLQFDPDPTRGGMQTAFVLDTVKNRKFLASHSAGNYWRIIEVVSGYMKEDGTEGDGEVLNIGTVRKEIAKVREQLIKKAIDASSGSGQKPNEELKSTMFDIADLDNDIIETEFLRRKKLKEDEEKNKKLAEDAEKAKIINNKKDLTPAQKSKITKANNKAKKAVLAKKAEIAKNAKLAKKSEVVETKVDPVTEEEPVKKEPVNAIPTSSFLNKSPVGMEVP